MTVVNTLSSRAATFGAMSAALTGFKPDFIAPEPDPNRLSAHLLEQVDERAGATSVDQLLEQFTALQRQGLTPQQIADVMLGISPRSAIAKCVPASRAAPAAPTMRHYHVDITLRPDRRRSRHPSRACSG